MSSAQKNLYGLVAPALPVEGVYEYIIPPELIDKAQVGKRVLVPFGSRKITGYLIDIRSQAEVEKEKLKPIIQFLDEEPLFIKEQMPLFRFCSDYYQTPLGEVLKTALPSGINVFSKKLIKITEKGKESIRATKGKARKLLELLEQFEELSKEKLSVFLEEPVSDALISNLNKKGLIEIVENIEPAKIKPKIALEVKLKRKPSQEEELYLAQRAPKQYQLFLLLKNSGPLLIDELRDQFKNPLALVKALEKRGIVSVNKKRVERKPFTLELLPYSEPENLTPFQKQALEKIRSAIIEERAEVFLLFGVTGSGKTEVYIQSARIALARGKTVLILVPEIALTPQLLHRFRSRFPEQKIAVLHSGLSPAERFDQWWQILRGEVSMVIGARSAIFAPLKNLGLIVVDEEQDSAYKQESGMRYNARDLAVWRGKNQKAVVILGSATPSLESVYNAQQGKYHLLKLPERIDSRPLPQTIMIDLRKELRPKNEQQSELSSISISPEKEIEPTKLISPLLQQELKENFRRGNQAIIFLNRRGFAPSLICQNCGYCFVCPNCSVALTWHQKRTKQRISPIYGELKSDSYLLCHYCGYHQPMPQHCPKCLSADIRKLGMGTERVEEELKNILPQARIARMDRDTMGSRRAYFELIQQMEIKAIDILVGTQMVAKGHDLAGVTLVGVLLADQSLNIPDFRSSERTFQLLTQVAGRAGRRDLPGKVIIQTFNPEHYSITCALAQDYWKFFEKELELRKALGYPPFSRLCLIRTSSIKAEVSEKAIKELAKIARALKRRKEFKQAVRLLGPAPAPIFRLRARARFQLLVFTSSAQLMSRFLKELLKRCDFLPSSVRLELDRDPSSLL